MPAFCWRPAGATISRHTVTMLRDDDALRYSRHLLLDDWTEDTQARLLASRVLVVGAGGLGCPALLYLAAAGVGHITVVDPDEVELSNLQRQVLHATDQVGQPKVRSAALGMARINPGVQVDAVQALADDAWLDAHLPSADVVLDCTDLFTTRHAINRACATHRKPLVSASALRYDGQLAVFDHAHDGTACYACLFPPEHPPEETRCALLGVFGPLVGAMGVMQAGEAIALLAGLAARPVATRLRLLDGRSWESSAIRVAPRTGCPVCAVRPVTVPGGPPSPH